MVAFTRASTVYRLSAPISVSDQTDVLSFSVLRNVVCIELMCEGLRC